MKGLNFQNICFILDLTHKKEKLTASIGQLLVNAVISIMHYSPSRIVGWPTYLGNKLLPGTIEIELRSGNTGNNAQLDKPLVPMLMP